jgi:hypothetical protein
MDEIRTLKRLPATSPAATRRLSGCSNGAARGHPKWRRRCWPARRLTSRRERSVGRINPATRKSSSGCAAWLESRAVGRLSAGKARSDRRPVGARPEDKQRNRNRNDGQRKTQPSCAVHMAEAAAVPQEQWDEQGQSEQQLDGESAERRRRNRQRPMAGPITTNMAADSIIRLCHCACRRRRHPVQTAKA